METTDNKSQSSTKIPSWIKVKAPTSKGCGEVDDLLRSNHLVTVCEEAACPNIGECWAKKHAAVMILGSVCTRNCKFCNIAKGRPDPVNPEEPEGVAHTVKTLGLKHVVITSVDRDDLPDGGAGQFVRCIEEIRKVSPATTIELLTPDFQRKPGALEAVVAAKPDVFNHNIEVVPRLFPSICPGARYFFSLNVLKRVKELDPNMFTKSGLMVGLGESKEEILQVMDDMRDADIDFITIGQYLRPDEKHWPVDRYVSLEEFKYYEEVAYKKGFLMVSTSPLTRSSHHAGEDFEKMWKARVAKNNK